MPNSIKKNTTQYAKALNNGIKKLLPKAELRGKKRAQLEVSQCECPFIAVGDEFMAYGPAMSGSYLWR
ncbi:hypothetical protein [Microcoleus sp. FACHB-672]|uniref:hypothetical protein n=1 Tax=Microcoleus sp. FACHB-672 TaxID=2692825 RepID=UPI0016838167|nr:hypothetical protein [Microcoleus sp. FACHB-672]MBD2039579.1 hypothetical protein [Microcoleus sp. FACHB-672]